MVSQMLNEKHFGTLLFDLLTKEEDEIFANRFNIPVLSKRLVEVTKWMMNQDYNSENGYAYFGASTGAASALYAAAELGDSIKAVVSRGGRPDLAIPVLHKVKSPTLLLVGGLDAQVIELNEIAFEKINAEKKLQIINGATHVFEEPGKLEEVAGAAIKWYQKYLV
jgi:pimeloyl-ACP methyl ester carboxylesterase